MQLLGQLTVDVFNAILVALAQGSFAGVLFVLLQNKDRKRVRHMILLYEAPVFFGGMKRGFEPQRRKNRLHGLTAGSAPLSHPGHEDGHVDWSPLRAQCASVE